METLIVGGGLSGLALAEALEAQGRDYLLVEARERFGGRIMTEHHDGGSFDMGPAWFWPGQPRIAALIERLGLEAFDQFSDGALSFEDETGRVQRGRGYGSMQGSLRLRGGLSAVTDRLAAGLPAARRRLNAPVTGIACSGGQITVTLAHGETLHPERVVLALPPRVAAEIAFQPALPSAAMQAMRETPTWMAGQAKALAIYDQPFWRDAGLSGDATSRHGPMVEIHDASPAQGEPYALFGFIGSSPQARTDEQVLRQHLTAQLTRLFGCDAAEPAQLYIKDWAFDPFTATQADAAPLHAHPNYGLPPAMARLWDATLLFAGTETAPQFGGYLEGALEASENALNVVQASGAACRHAH